MTEPGFRPDGLFCDRVYLAVAAIPAGQVATYGTIAALAGSPRAARQVGSILCRLPEDTRLPWYRVVNRFGLSSLVGEAARLQYQLLQQEGLVCSAVTPIDLRHHAWYGD